MGNLVAHPLTPDRWDDLVEVFGGGEGRGDCGRCWCMWWRLPRKAVGGNAGRGNKALFAARVQDGPPPGLVGYDGDGVPVGWVQVGPRADVPVWNDPGRLTAPLAPGDAAACGSGGSAASSCGRGIAARAISPLCSTPRSTGPVRTVCGHSMPAPSRQRTSAPRRRSTTGSPRRSAPGALPRSHGADRTGHFCGCGCRIARPPGDRRSADYLRNNTSCAFLSDWRFDR